LPCWKLLARPEPLAYSQRMTKRALDTAFSIKPLLLVGAGNMGTALLTGWRKRGLPAGSIAVLDPQPSETARESSRNLFRELPRHFSPRAIVLAVKPQVVDSILPALIPHMAPDVLVLSIIAGKTIAQLSEGLNGHTNIVRAMPNTPASITAAVSGAFRHADVTAADKLLASRLLEAVGTCVWLEKEAHINAVTALSGSGPAYIFYMIECMINAGEKLGLSADVARVLAIETVAGAGALAKLSDDDVAVLRQKVTSPGGTTQAGLDILMSPYGLGTLMRHTLEAANKRAKELGG
jgi:pyrroline-5-carboxylate reductase